MPSFFGVPSTQFNPLNSQEKQAKMMLAQQQQQQQANIREKQIHHAQMHSAGGFNPSHQQSNSNPSNMQSMLSGLNITSQQHSPFNLAQQQQSHSFRDRPMSVNNIPPGSGMSMSTNQQQQFRDQLSQGYSPQQQQMMNMGINVPPLDSGMFPQIARNHSQHQPNQDLLQGFGQASSSSAMGPSSNSFYDRPMGSGPSSSLLPNQHHQQQSHDQHIMGPSSNLSHTAGPATRDPNLNSRHMQSSAPAMLRPSSTDVSVQDSSNGFHSMVHGETPSQNQNPYPHTQAFYGAPDHQHGHAPSRLAQPGATHQHHPLQPLMGGQTQQHRATPTPLPSISPPGSPYRGSKRKISESPRMGAINTGLPNPGPMGPPSLPRSLSASSSDMSSTFLGCTNPQVSVPSAQVAPIHRPGSGLGMNGVGMGMNSSVVVESPSRPMLPQLQQHQQKHARQGSVPAGVPPSEGVGLPHAPSIVSPTGAPLLMSHTVGSLSGPAATSALQGSTSVLSSQGVSTPPRHKAQAPTAQPSPSTSTNTSTTVHPSIPGLNPAVSLVTTIPLAESSTQIPPLTSEEIADVQKWMAIDRAYQNSWAAMRKRADTELRTAVSHVPWWEKGGSALEGNGNRWRRPDEGFHVRFPRSKRETGGLVGSVRRKGKREGLKLPKRLRPEEANRQEQLVPIRLEFDVEHHKMRDTFVWNLNDPIVTPENFAQSIVEDYNLSPAYHVVIVKAIQEQLSDFRAHMGFSDFDGTVGETGSDSPVMATAKTLPEEVDHDGDEVAPRGGILEGEEEEWWDRWRECMTRNKGRKNRKGKGKKRRKVAREDGGVEGDVEDSAQGDDGEDEEASFWRKHRPLRIDQIKVNDATMCEDMRIAIKLDIIVGSMKLEDQFEWDLDSESASPEEFAEVYVQELGLGGEFKTAIAHCIREQVQAYQKTLFLLGNPSDGSSILDEDLRSSFLPSLTSATRASDQVQAFTPLLSYLSDGELERSEKDRDKDMNKRRKRNTRGRRGITLPDREPLRTHRTPAMGFPELDPSMLAVAATPNAPISRRAAAAAASLTIASMVASENGTTFVPQMATPSSSAAVIPAAMKDKKAVKGFFKAPVYPSAVRRTRAQLTAPTPSTAADVTTLPAPLENDPPPELPAPPVVASAPPPPTVQETRTTKSMSLKRARELEREAKEREFADGQHANMINGVWHCSNCGCPESIAIGRRKGPLGDKSQCGACGKFWHRHRRPRPVEYNPDPEYHNGLKRESEAAKTAASAKKKGSRSQGSTVPPTPKETSEPPRTPRPRSQGGDADMSSRQSPVPTLGLDDDRAMSPVSSASSVDEPPLSQRVKMNGRASSPATAMPSTPNAGSGANGGGNSGDGNSEESSPVKESSPNIDAALPNSPPKPPLWLTKAKEAMMEKYPDDNFILRKAHSGSTGEWRIKCLDCPGKLYTPGPAESLGNYEVHLKNRQHRQRVNERLNLTNGLDS